MKAPIPPAFVECAQQLSGLAGRERAARRRELENLFQVSSSTMSRWLHDLGIVCHQRCDRGARRVQVRDEHLAAVFAIQYSSNKQQQGPIMPAEVAIDIAEKNGVIPQDTLTASSYNAWLRAQGATRARVDEPEPHVDLVSLGPNHVHQADFSLAINWKIKNNQAIYDQFVYKNKLPKEGDLRLLRLVVTDHCSGAFFVWYEAAKGEDVQTLIRGLWRAWQPKMCGSESVQGLYPFRGVPRLLMLDRGPGNKSVILKNFLDWLGVELNICVGSRSKGQVENMHWAWEQSFESRFRIDPVVSLERLNDEAVQYAAWYCKEKKHGRHKGSRTAHWEFHINRSMESTLRVPNCSFEEAVTYATKTHFASVGGSGQIQFKGQRYRVPDALLYEKQVVVQYSPFDFPSITVKGMQAGAQPYVCSPIVLNEHGFPVQGAAVIGQDFKRHAQSERARMTGEAAKALEQLTAERRIVTRGYHLEGLEASGIRSKESPIAAEPEQKYFTLTDAMFEVIDRVGRPLSAAEKQVFRRFSDRVTESEISAVVDEITSGIGAAVLPFRAAL